MSPRLIPPKLSYIKPYVPQNCTANNRTIQSLSASFTTLRPCRLEHGETAIYYRCEAMVKQWLNYCKGGGSKGKDCSPCRGRGGEPIANQLESRWQIDGKGAARGKRDKNIAVIYSFVFSECLNQEGTVPLKGGT